MSPQRGVKASQLDYEDHRLGLFNGEASLVSGRYITGLDGGSSSEFTNGTIGRLWASPLPVSRALTIDRLAVDVTTLQAASLNRLGLYASTADGLPGALLVDGGTVDTSTTGLKEVTVDVAVNPGLYWGAWEYDVASVGLRGRPENGSMSLGHPTPGNQPYGILFVAHTFGALPDPFGTPGSYFSNSTVKGNVVYARVAL